ncbi:MAG: hypothetical protein ACT4PT_08040 [Methanobacteriota archaeon]
MVHTVKISDRNQVALPQDALDAIGAHRGERLLVRVHQGVLELIPEPLAERLLDRGLDEFRKAGLSTFEKYWDNAEDEAWNEA